MPNTFYLDYEGGSDAADGLSFANRWKTLTSGATAARTAPGDTIRIMGSPAPTSLGINATWTNRTGGLAPTVSITSSTNASPIVVTRANHGLSNGDTVVITGHTTNTNANGTWEIANVATNTFELVGSTGNGVGGATGTYRLRNNTVVRLASALTAEIASWKNTGEGRVAWTASANVTCTLSTADFKCGDSSDSIAIAAGFTTGLAAYFNTGTLDLSGYQQVSFWIKQTSGTIGAASSCSLGLYANTGGGSLQHTINIPALGALNRWHVFTVDLATNLHASIDSIGFIVNTDNGAQTFLINNVIACKAASSADSLSLTSLIGKNTGSETWHGMQSIVGTRVMLDADTNSMPINSTCRGYSGTTETVTTYKRETIKTTVATSSGTVVQSTTDSGTSGNLISYEGGWDRTNMTTQNLETIFDGQNGFGQGVAFGIGGNYCSLNKVSGVRYDIGIVAGQVANRCTINNALCLANNTTAGFRQTDRGYAVTIGDMICNNNLSNGVSMSSGGYGYKFTGTLRLMNNGGSSTTGGMTANGAYGTQFNEVIAANSDGVGFYIVSSPESLIRSLETYDNGRQGVCSGGGLVTILTGLSRDNGIGAFAANIAPGTVARDFTVSDATVFSLATGNQYGANPCVYFHDYGGVADDHRIYHDGGLIRSEASVRHTASGLAWSMAVTNTVRTVEYPLQLSLASFPVVASALVTVKAWMKRSDTGLTMRLVCKGGQIAGVSADVTASMTEADPANWEELTITFTPSEDGVVEILAEAYGGTTYTGYVDDLTITQTGQPTVTELKTLDFAFNGGPFCIGAGSGSSGGLKTHPGMTGGIGA